MKKLLVFLLFIVISILSINNSFASDKIGNENILEAMKTDGIFYYEGIYFNLGYDKESFMSVDEYVELSVYNVTKSDLKFVEKVDLLINNLNRTIAGKKKIEKIKSALFSLVSQEQFESREKSVNFKIVYILQKILVDEANMWMNEKAEILKKYTSLKSYKKYCSQVNHESIVSIMHQLGYKDYTVQKNRISTSNDCLKIIDKMELMRQSEVYTLTEGDDEKLFFVFNEYLGNEFKEDIYNSKVGSRFCKKDSSSVECYWISDGKVESHSYVHID